jgi:Flp pilus assembly protein TadB
VSKDRARRRLERETLARQRKIEHESDRRKQLARQQRRSRWARLLGRRGASSTNARTKERRAVIASTLLVVVVLTYLMTRSIAMVIGILLIASIATPALVAVFLDRSKK